MSLIGRILPEMNNLGRTNNMQRRKIEPKIVNFGQTLQFLVTLKLPHSCGMRHNMGQCLNVHGWYEHVHQSAIGCTIVDV